MKTTIKIILGSLAIVMIILIGYVIDIVKLVLGI
jgi:hypothetical protein